MKSKEDVKTLIQTIKQRTGKSQEAIAIEAGYAPKSLTQMLSKGGNLDLVYRQLNLVYKDVLNGSTIQEPQPKQAAAPETISLRQHCEMLNKHYEDMKGTKDELLKIVANLSESLKEVKSVKDNLSDATSKQQTFRVQMRANQQIMLETLSELRGLNKDALVRTARNLGNALLELNEQDDMMTLSDTANK